MEASAKLRFVRMSPQKGRLIADMVRGKKVGDALSMLRFTNTKPAKILEKLLKSARANAEDKNVGDPDSMTIKTVMVDKGPVMKRQLPRARGRVDVLKKPFSHITLILESHGEEEGAKRKAPPAKKGVAKKGAEVKTEKKSEAVKGEAEKAPARKAPVKKTSTKKPVVKKAADAKKGTAKKAAAKKTVAKKTVAKKSAAKKTTAKKSAKKK